MNKGTTWMLVGNSPLDEGEYKVTRERGKLVIYKKVERVEVTSECDVILTESQSGRGFYITLKHNDSVVALVNPAKGIETRSPYEVTRDSGSHYSFRVFKTNQ